MSPAADAAGRCPQGCGLGKGGKGGMRRSQGGGGDRRGSVGPREEERAARKSWAIWPGRGCGDPREEETGRRLHDWPGEEVGPLGLV